MDTTTQFTKVLLEGGSFALLVFLAVWTVRFAIPQILASFKETSAQNVIAVRELQQQYLTSIRELKESALVVQNQYRIDLDRTHERFAQAIEKNTEAILSLERAIRGDQKPS